MGGAQSLTRENLGDTVVLKSSHVGTLAFYEGVFGGTVWQKTTHTHRSATLTERAVVQELILVVFFFSQGWRLAVESGGGSARIQAGDRT